MKDHDKARFVKKEGYLSTGIHEKSYQQLVDKKKISHVLDQEDEDDKDDREDEKVSKKSTEYEYRVSDAEKHDILLASKL